MATVHDFRDAFHHEMAFWRRLNTHLVLRLGGHNNADLKSAFFGDQVHAEPTLVVGHCSVPLAAQGPNPIAAHWYQGDTGYGRATEHCTVGVNDGSPDASLGCLTVGRHGGQEQELRRSVSFRLNEGGAVIGIVNDKPEAGSGDSGLEPGVAPAPAGKGHLALLVEYSCGDESLFGAHAPVSFDKV
jgi:hypothetical protein